MTLGAADLPPSNDNTTIFVIVGGIGLVALAVIILGLVRRFPKEVTPHASTWWAAREHTRAIV